MTVEEQAKRDLKAELEGKEAKHFKQKAGDVFEGAPPPPPARRSAVASVSAESDPCLVS